MLCVWWNSEGVIHWEFVPSGCAVDVDLNSQQLEMVHEILRRRYPSLVRNGVLLQHDNAIPHTAQTTMTKIQELGEIELLPHQEYRPDLAPTDYHLSNPWPISCVKGLSKILKLWKWVSSLILRIRSQRLVSSRDDKPRWKMAQYHKILRPLFWRVV